MHLNKIKERGQDINRLIFTGRKYEDTLSIVSSSSQYEERLTNIRWCIRMGSRLDPERHAYTWLCIISGGDIEEVGTLLDQYPAMLRARFFGAGQDGLCAALIDGNASMVKFLLSRGANPNQYTGWYTSTLHRAEDEDTECATLIRYSEFAILLVKASRFGAAPSTESSDTAYEWIAQNAMTALSPDLQIELASYFWDV